MNVEEKERETVGKRGGGGKGGKERGMGAVEKKELESEGTVSTSIVFVFGQHRLLNPSRLQNAARVYEQVRPLCNNSIWLLESVET